jgi:hypothetical protein
MIKGASATMTAGANANDNTHAVLRDTVRGSKNRTITGAIKELFHTIANIITGRCANEPLLETRRGQGDSGGAFNLAAKETVRHVVRIPSDCWGPPVECLEDGVLNRWNGDPALFGDELAASSANYPDSASPSNHLHPHF